MTLMEADQCSVLVTVQHIVLAFFQLLTTCFTAWLVQRRYRADKREKQNGANKSNRTKHYL